MQNVDREAADLQKAHQQQRQRDILGEVGMGTNNAGHGDLAVVAEDDAAPPNIHDAHAQHHKPEHQKARIQRCDEHGLSSHFYFSKSGLKPTATGWPGLSAPSEQYWILQAAENQHRR